MLYLASTEETAISEVRPWVGSELSVARFRVTRRLEAIDLTWGHGKSSSEELTLKQLWGEEELDAGAKEKAVWTDIDNAFSRPVTLSDGSDNYVPTRILAELFQEAGFDGNRVSKLVWARRKRRIQHCDFRVEGCRNPQLCPVPS